MNLLDENSPRIKFENVSEDKKKIILEGVKKYGLHTETLFIDEREANYLIAEIRERHYLSKIFENENKNNDIWYNFTTLCNKDLHYDAVLIKKVTNDFKKTYVEAKIRTEEYARFINSPMIEQVKFNELLKLSNTTKCPVVYLSIYPSLKQASLYKINKLHKEEFEWFERTHNKSGVHNSGNRKKIVADIPTKYIKIINIE